MKRKERQFIMLMLMHDRGMRHSFRIRATFFYALLCAAICMPFLVGGLAWFSYHIHQKNHSLQESILRSEDDYHKAQSLVERLGNIEQLQNENAIAGKDILLRRLAASSVNESGTFSDTQASEGANDEEPAQAQQDTAQQDVFQPINTDFVRLENVSARTLRANKLLIALDLHNTDNQKIAAGRISAVLFTTNGTRHAIEFVPNNVGDFRITRFKRAVMLAELTAQMNPVNAQVIIQVHKEDGSIVYRNLFAVER